MLVNIAAEFIFTRIAIRFHSPSLVYMQVYELNENIAASHCFILSRFSGHCFGSIRISSSSASRIEKISEPTDADKREKGEIYALRIRASLMEIALLFRDERMAATSLAHSTVIGRTCMI